MCTDNTAFMTEADEILHFMKGGKATFTIVSRKTGARYTYRARRAKHYATMFFVSTLVGSDNENDYEYIGYFNATPVGTSGLRSGKKGNPADVRFKGLHWLLETLNGGRVPSTVEFWHEGRCARCNRLLTDPVSIARGFGPECANK